MREEPKRPHERLGDHPAVQRFNGTSLDWLVESLADGMLQPFDLILDHQLTALQLDYLQIIGGKVHERFMQFIL
jgi:hypothetical protein